VASELRFFFISVDPEQDFTGKIEKEAHHGTVSDGDPVLVEKTSKFFVKNVQSDGQDISPKRWV
jgi:hypothetical protein